MSSGQNGITAEAGLGYRAKIRCESKFHGVTQCLKNKSERGKEAQKNRVKTLVKLHYSNPLAQLAPLQALLNFLTISPQLQTVMV
jgi:hypothetical protein